MMSKILLIGLTIVVVAIVILLANKVPRDRRAIEEERLVECIRDIEMLKAAAKSYYADMGFWPPDVWWGVDPGFMQPLPGGDPEKVYATGLPTDWQNVVQKNWGGPYLDKWLDFTPWGGEYDWNYWPHGGIKSGGGVNVPPGCYIGVLNDLTTGLGGGHISPFAEQKMIEKGLDADGEVNGQVQVTVMQW